jgi:hypothetical protein
MLQLIDDIFCFIGVNLFRLVIALVIALAIATAFATAISNKPEGLKLDVPNVPDCVTRSLLKCR